MEYAFASMGPTLEWVALGVIFIGLLAVLGAAYTLASLPGKLARGRNHPQAEAINICGWLGLPSGVFWLFALVWAYYRPDSPGQIDSTALAQQIAKLESVVSLLEQRKVEAQL